MSDARERIEAWLKAHEKPEIHIDYAKPSAPIPVGASKIGGCPDVPAGFVWPRFKGGETVDEERADMERPLSFMAQFDMAEVSAFDTEGLLPKAGHLAFFYDYEGQCWGETQHRGCSRVFYFPQESALERITIPEDMDEFCHIPELALSFSTRTSRPVWEYLPDEMGAAVQDEDLWDALWPGRQEGGCQLLGWVDPIQGPVELECQKHFFNLDWEEHKEAIEKGAADWLLLFQLDGIYIEDYVSMDVLGGGRMYFCIRQQDLALKDFNNAWLIAQC